MIPWARRLLLLPVALLLAGCGSLSGIAGQLPLGTARFTIGLELCPGQVATATATEWYPGDFTTGTPVTLQDVRVLGADGLEQVRSVVVESTPRPDGGSSAVGALIGYPPPRDLWGEQDWTQAAAVPGAVITPRDTIRKVYVVLRLAPGSREGTSSGLLLRYRDGEHLLVAPSSYRLTRAPECR